MRAAIVGIEGPELTHDEAALFAAYPPAGAILFARNVVGASQVARLIGDLREVMPAGARMLVDQEGGRVARLRPPDWSVQPAAGLIGELHAVDPAAAIRLAWLTGAVIGMECRGAGFDVVCAPVLDLRWAGATDAIGDRSYGADPEAVAALANAMADGLLSAGVQPVGKHAPGHGQARVDSHRELPRIGAERDIGQDVNVFSRCRALPWMMTAHITYVAIDEGRPASLSPVVIEQVIRGEIGFEGVLVSDDLAMGALAGAPGAMGALTGAPGLLAREAVAAGCDLAMHCSGRLDETEAVLAAVPVVSDLTIRRMARGVALAGRSQLPLNHAALLADQAALLEAFVAG